MPLSAIDDQQSPIILTEGDFSMKLRSYVFVAAAMFATFAVAFDETSDFKAGIQKEMAKYIKAIKTKDVAGMEKVLRANFAPDFKDTDKTGRVINLQQTITSMKPA